MSTGTACSPIQLLLATFEPQACGKCVIPVKCLCRIWCWPLWQVFLASCLKKIQPNNNNKKLQTTPRHQSSWRCPAKPTLPPQGCWDPINHPDTGSTKWFPGSARTPAEMSDTNQPHFWLHSIQETSWDDSCNFHIPTFLPLLPSHCRDTQLHHNLTKSYAATSPNGTWELKVYLQQNSTDICRSYFENLLVQMPRTTWQGLTDIIRELDCFKERYPRKLLCCCGSWNKFPMGLVAEVLQGF